MATTNQRRIFMNMKPVKVQEYITNRVRRSKYTLWNFLPKNIFEQFRGAANFYFLVLGILQSVHPFKEVDPLITILPLLIIFLSTAVKDGFEDFKRHQADDMVNKSKGYILDGYVNPNGKHALSKNPLKRVLNNLWKTIKNQFRKDAVRQIYPSDSGNNLRDSIVSSTMTLDPSFKPCDWENIRVGHFVLLREGDQIPADILILSTSEPECVCFIETKNLDGETNLKVKQGIPEINYIKEPKDCFNIKGYVDAESPNPNLYNFQGRLVLSQNDQETEIPIGNGGLLLRGCILRNTAWVIGMVLYTGLDTKIMLNAGPTPSKRSKVDKQVNPQILLNCIILAALSVICAVNSALYSGTFVFSSPVYLGTTKEDIDIPWNQAIFTFFMSLILFQNIIPIALYISLEVSKSIQSYLIHVDTEMWDEESGKSVQPKAWNLCDDLGQIEYIFSDKTGTLTSNQMEFRKASINGIVYGSMSNYEQDNITSRKKFEEIFEPKFFDREPSFVDPLLPQHIKENGLQAVKIREFFSLLAVCHTVLVDRPAASNSHTIRYLAQSPDEAALVSAAKNAGFACLDRTDNKVEVDVMGNSRVYTILNIMEFNSDRKRMSVIIKRPEGDVILLCKGADSVIYERLDKEKCAAVMEVTSEHLQQFANDGLRTLCLAYRTISQEDYQVWSGLYRKAQASMEDRETECDQLADMIERDLTLMGATAIEDKLQAGVPESIATLAKAGIKLWVLTGDKIETAINIGFSCNLLTKSMTLIMIHADSLEETKKQLTQAIERFWDAFGVPKNGADLALVIDGTSLKYALEPECKQLLLELGCRCKSVLCCRVSPLQKALVVRLVKEGLGAMCLAIGDGANDVSMIQEADIGIGISGKEGMQAVMASDYAISQFRFLSRLLLVHGRWAYIRSAELVLNYFYKNILWLLIQFWQQFQNGFSSGLAMDFTYGMFMNTIFSALTTTTIGIFDQDINSSLSLMFPQIYLKGIRQEMYCNSRFWAYAGHALYQSVVCYYGVYFLFNDNSFSPFGYDIDASVSSTIMATVSIIILNAFSTCNWHTWNWITHASFWGSVIPFFIYVAIYSSGADSPVFGIFRSLFAYPSFYCMVVLLIFVSLFPRLLIKYYQRELHPNDTDLLQEIQKMYWKSGINFDHLAKIINGEASTSSKSSIVIQYSDAIGTSSEKNIAALQIDTGADGFGIDTSVPAATSATGKSQRIQTLKRNVSVEQKSMDRSRTSSSISIAFKSGVQMASQFIKKLKPEKDKFTRGTSNLFFMGTNEEIPNTGFAFSHDTGMANIITPYRPTLPAVEEEDAGVRHRTGSVRSRFSDKASKQMRNISNSIKSVLRISHHQKPPQPSISASVRSVTGKFEPHPVDGDIPEDSNEGPSKEPKK